jgi:hypothetical protein
MRVFLILSLALLLQSCGKDEKKSLSGDELTRLVSGNTQLGQSPNADSVYEINFLPNKRIFLRRDMDDKNISSGRWDVEGDAIVVDWQPGPGDKAKKMRYVHVKDNVYDVYDAESNKRIKSIIMLPGIVHLEKGRIRSY